MSGSLKSTLAWTLRGPTGAESFAKIWDRNICFIIIRISLIPRIIRGRPTNLLLTYNSADRNSSNFSVRLRTQAR